MKNPRERNIGSRGALTLSGALLLVGFVVNAIQRMLWHPTGEEDDHEAIFTEYAASDAWVATHLAEFVLVLVALAGLLVLCRALRPERPTSRCWPLAQSSRPPRPGPLSKRWMASRSSRQ